MSPAGGRADEAPEGAVRTAAAQPNSGAPEAGSPGAGQPGCESPPQSQAAEPDPHSARGSCGQPFPAPWASNSGCCLEHPEPQPQEHQQRSTESRRPAPLRALRSLEWLLVELLVLPIRGYQRFISPFTPPTCRFRPTCSAYALEALRSHGMLRGGFLALRRILRCHPFSEPGPDPVPAPRSPRRTPL